MMAVGAVGRRAGRRGEAVTADEGLMRRRTNMSPPRIDVKADSAATTAGADPDWLSDSSPGMSRPPRKGRRSSDMERPPRTPLSVTSRPASGTANMWDDADHVLGTGVVTPKAGRRGVSGANVSERDDSKGAGHTSLDGSGRAALLVSLPGIHTKHEASPRQDASAEEAAGEEGPVWLPPSPASRTAALEPRPGNAAGLNSRRLARAASDNGSDMALARMSLAEPNASAATTSATVRFRVVVSPYSTGACEGA